MERGKQALDGVALSRPGVLTNTGISFSSELSGTADTFKGPFAFFIMQMSPLQLKDWASKFLMGIAQA